MIWRVLIRMYTLPLMTRSCPCTIINATHTKPLKPKMSEEIKSNSRATCGTKTSCKFKRPVSPKTASTHPRTTPCTQQAMRSEVATTPTSPPKSQRPPTGFAPPAKSVKPANLVSMLAPFSTTSASKSIQKRKKRRQGPPNLSQTTLKTDKRKKLLKSLPVLKIR